MVGKSVIREAREIHLAIDLIKLGARLQFLEAETSLSRDRLIKLYKEIKGVSPPKGLLPFSTDWFMTWLSNIHSSMFYNIYRFMVTHGDCTRINAVIKSYRLYLEQVAQQGGTGSPIRLAGDARDRTDASASGQPGDRLRS